MNTTFLNACYRKQTKQTPVWYMRQAGRYLPEYRKLKGEKNILDIVKTPELAAKICMLPVDTLNVDAAVLYADIMIPLLGIGVDLEIVESIGPVIHSPIQMISDVKRIRKLEPHEDIPYIEDTIKMLKSQLDVPLIGFSAAPFTLASYLIEGKPSRDFIKTKTFMLTEPKAWHLLMEKLTTMIGTYLTYQTASGVDALQLFDSWVGCLSADEYQEYVLPYSRKIFAEMKKDQIPLIHFGTNNAGFLKSFASVPCDVIGVDWRIPIDTAWKEIGYEKALQGNLDPALLLADFSTIKKHVDKIFGSLPHKEGYIFNLGHGVLPNTPVDTIKQLTEYIHKK